MSILVTAGATRNPIDAVRYLSAHSSGRTGGQISQELLDLGADVWLLGSEEARLRSPNIPGETYGSTNDLMEKMRLWVEAHPAGGVIHSAAVGDYGLLVPQSAKIPSGQRTWTLELSAMPKIADRVREWGCSGIYVTFKAAGPNTSPEELIAICYAQRERTGCDIVFGNVLGALQTSVVLVGQTATPYPDRSSAIRALVSEV